MKRFATTLMLMATTLLSIAQKDPKATEILDNLTEKTKSHSSIQVDFTYAIKSDDISEEQKGTLLLKGDQYKYNIFGITKISDGKSIATVAPMDEEIIITDANYDDPDEVSPQEMFSIYKEGFKYRFIKTVTENGRSFEMIELYPDAGNESPYRRITMYIDASKSELYRIEFYPKTSSRVFSITLNTVKYDVAVPANTFKVDCSIEPDYDCDDQRGSK